jgi:hypothetical protein
MFLSSACKSPLNMWRDVDITEFLYLRRNSIRPGFLDAQHTAWNSQVSNPSSLKLLHLFENCYFEILAPKISTRFLPNGKGVVLDIVVHNMSGCQRSAYWTFRIEIAYPSYFASWIVLRLGKILDAVAYSQISSGFKTSPLI